MWLPPTVFGFAMLGNSKYKCSIQYKCSIEFHCSNLALQLKYRKTDVQATLSVKNKKHNNSITLFSDKNT